MDLFKSFLAVLIMSLFFTLSATETENHKLQILPKPGDVTIDGKIDDWDLSGGVFTCGELEHLRDKYSLWFHAMYDEDNVYLLARWNDPTPLNNTETYGGHGFKGDCLQVRFIMFPDDPAERTVSWWDFWRTVNGRPVAGRAWPGPRNGVKDNPLKPLTEEECKQVKQAFLVNKDGKGYTQEIMIPWKLLSASGKKPRKGDKFGMTIEPNFTAGEFGRITIKDIFNPDSKKPDRIFTFRAYRDWGTAELMKSGHLEPADARVADGRTFKVSMEDGKPVVDWTGLIQKFEWPGFKNITFEMPFDGFVSLNILDKDGRIVRHLLTWDKRSKGKHKVVWDGLTDAVYRIPGKPVPAGEYSWKAIAHPGAKLTFRGFAHGGPSVPWVGGPKDLWLGDHGVPSDVKADGERVYLACNGAEGGRHLLATDPEGHILWALQNTTGAGDPNYIAIDDECAYVLHPKSPRSKAGSKISRVDKKTGAYAQWQGKRNHILKAEEILNGQEGTISFKGIAAGDGRLYVAACDPFLGKNDVTDWKKVVTILLEDKPLSKQIMAEISNYTKSRLKRFLAGKETEERTFATWNGGPRFDNDFITACNKRIADGSLIKGSDKMSGLKREFAAREFLRQYFQDAIKKLDHGQLLSLDAKSGKLLKSVPLAYVGALCFVSKNKLYAVVNGNQVVAVDPDTGKVTPLIKGLQNIYGVNTDEKGHIYVSVREPDMQVIAYSQGGKELRRYGRKGGHCKVGKWQPDGMRNPGGVAVDKKGQLWVMEGYRFPKRVSVWDRKTGKLIRDIFGPTHYGASGGAINPRNPDLMVGEGVEWRLNPKTGKAECLGAFDEHYHSYATFREGGNGKLYLFTFEGRYGVGDIQVWERLGDADYRLRATITTGGEMGRGKVGFTEIWVDKDGDGKKQDNEIEKKDGAFICRGSNNWTINVGPDLALYGADMKDNKLKVLKPAGFNASGAPKYSFRNLKELPAEMSKGFVCRNSSAYPSADNKRILLNIQDRNHPAGWLWKCFDLASGKLLWTYPNPYYQVHGSHHAPAPEPGLFRGAYNPIGAVNIPGVGDAWIINGNLGEWYMLSSDGYFVTQLFSGNIFEWVWPKKAVPGLDMTKLPPGCGGEDFGGSVIQGKDGKVYIQSGKKGVWNIVLSGLDKTVKIPGGKLSISEAETRKALALREDALQALAGGGKMTVKKQTVKFTGNLRRDFQGGKFVDFKKVEEARVSSVMAYDDKNLYVGWQVNDDTPWINGATDFSQIYATGDTVDLQLGTDAKANPKRTQAVKGDLRLAIGNYQGKPTAVLYKFKSDEKKSRTFSSGVVQGYEVDFVDILKDADIKVFPSERNKRYVVEAAIPLDSLGLKPKKGLKLKGDVGVTHGDPSGVRTKLRTHWSNQQTGLVDDVVFELQINPKNWGEIVFE